MKTQILKQRLRYVFLILVLTSCSNKPPEIVEFERAEKAYHREKFVGWDDKYKAYRSDPGGFFKEERFIVFNHPKNRSELIQLINDFNRTTMTKDSVLKYNRGYRRIFYKKTYNTMEAYNEDKAEKSLFFDIASCDDMENHNRNRKDLILGLLDGESNNAHLLFITWGADSEQRIDIVYYVYDDFKIISNVSDDELFNLK